MTSTRHPLHVFILDNGAYSIKAGWSALNEPIPFDPVALSSSVSSRSKPKSSKTKKKSSKKKGKKGSKNIRHQEDGELEAEEIEGEEEEILTPEEEYVKLYQAKIYPNAIARSKNEKRTYVADEVDACTDFAGMLYKRPFERGMLTAWDAQKVIWDHIFAIHKVDPATTSLLILESYNNLPGIGEAYDQMIFEEYGFASYYRCPPASVIPYSGLFEQEDVPAPECMVVVDIGYSYTHVVAMVDGSILSEGCKRIDVGGKLLTNQLKHLVSFRQWDMMEETHVINQVREDCCFVSNDWKKDMERARMEPSPIAQEYLLPDFSPNHMRGKIVGGPSAMPPPQKSKHVSKEVPDAGVPLPQDDQVLIMGNERFSVPELLFHPSDIGLNQSGLPEAIAQVIGSMDPDLQGMFWSNIGVIGGLAWMETLGERLDADLRALCPAEYEIALFEASDPTTEAFYAAQNMVGQRSDYFDIFPVTRKEYEEYGSEVCRRRFSATHGGKYTSNYAYASAGAGTADVGNEERQPELVKKRKPMMVSSGRKKKGKRSSLYGRADSDDGTLNDNE